MVHFATLFDRNYLARGLMLLESLRRHCPSFELYVLCLDDVTYEAMAAVGREQPGVIPVGLPELEAADPDLRAARANRSPVEYYFTLSPCLPLYLLRRYGCGHICTLDADQLFYADPTPLFGLLERRSVLITPHNFAPGLESARKFGAFNVSFQVFKNDPAGLGCLERWRSQCLEWCKDVYDEERGRFADQKYLDEWPALLGDRLHVFDHPGVGLAAWNVNRFGLAKDGAGYRVDGEPLVLFHFHGFKQLSARWAGNRFGLYHVRPTPELLELYGDYWRRLQEKQAPVGDGADHGVRWPTAGRLLERLVEERSLFRRRGDGRLRYVRLPGLVRSLLRLLARCTRRSSPG
jgi:hypothetical protein